MIKHSKIAALLDCKRKGFDSDPFYIVPCPSSLKPSPASVEFQANGAASIDLRLGTWFLAMRQTTMSLLEVGDPSELTRRLKAAADELSLGAYYKGLKQLLVEEPRDGRLARRYHVRFGEDFILHPRNFVLGVTLEWLRLPSNFGGYVIGRSSWGRRGLVIATATGVHPGFTGCLTLELANLGDIPIAIRPGMTIGQLFLHRVEANEKDHSVDQSSFACKRAPRLGHPKSDEIAKKLAYASL